MLYSGYFNAIISDQGVPIPATITVYLPGTSTKAVIYSDPGGTILKDNPFSTDVLGRFQFFVLPGYYDITISGTGIGPGTNIENITISGVGTCGQVKCSVWLNTTMDNLTDVTPTLVLLDTEIDDPGNNFSTVTHLFTCPVAGYYLVTGSIAFKDVIASKEYRAHIYINGASVSGTILQTSLAQNIDLPVAGIFKCAAGDTIGLGAYVNAGANTVDVYGGYLSRTRLEIHLLSLT